jgi:hypothetical protein
MFMEDSSCTQAENGSKNPNIPRLLRLILNKVYATSAGWSGESWEVQLQSEATQANKRPIQALQSVVQPLRCDQNDKHQG